MESLSQGAQHFVTGIKALAGTSKPGALLELGEIAKNIQHSNGSMGTCCRALPGFLKAFYAREGMQLEIPLYLIANKGDLFGTCDDGDGRVGPLGIVYKMALRELDGVYEDSKKKPSVDGIPAVKPKKAPKAKKVESDADVQQPEKKKRKTAAAAPLSVYVRDAVPAAECLVMFELLREYAEANGVAKGELYKVDAAALGL